MSQSWISVHYEQPFHDRRTAKIPGKLAKVGVLDLDRDAQILDACCGRGEALAALRALGFRRVVGVDLLRHPEWDELTECSFRACDVCHMPFADGHFDAITMLHALHHMGDAKGVQEVLAEYFRVLRPGGKVFIVDFPSSVQIKVLFWLLRKRLGAVTPSLLNFARILDEEWPYLSGYLQQWRAVRAQLDRGPFTVIGRQTGLFLYYLTLLKPEDVSGRVGGAR